MRYLLIVLAVAACHVDATDKREAEPYEIRAQSIGSADGGGLLSSEDLQRLRAAFDQVIAEGQDTIDTLEAEIAALEASNAGKAQQIDQLVAQIAQRRSELEEQHRRNLILCALFPSPAFCVLAVMIDNDSRMQQLESELAAAQAAQTRIRREIRDYERERDALRAELEPVRDARDRLIALFEAGTSAGPVPDVLEPGSAEAHAWARAAVLEDLSRATDDEIAILVDIRNSAAALAASLDQVLAEVTALATSVDSLVQEARDDFMRLLEALLGPDPDAAASAWLDEAIAERTREMLNGLDWPYREFVEHLVASRPGDAIDLDALIEDILDRLLAGQPGRMATYTNTVAQLILDHTEAISTIPVTETWTASRAEVRVQLAHTYVGDLSLVLDTGSQQIVLRNRTGGAADDIDETFTVDLAPAAAAGPWQLRIHDHAAQDQGELQQWSLTLYE